jgi:hypothetical protein
MSRSYSPPCRLHGGSGTALLLLVTRIWCILLNGLNIRRIFAKCVHLLWINKRKIDSVYCDLLVQNDPHFLSKVVTHGKLRNILQLENDSNIDACISDCQSSRTPYIGQFKV